MSAQAQDKRLFVDDVVTALTGSVLASGNARPVLEDQMRRATEEFDLRTAEAFARALLEALCQDPIDPRRLEALLILGLAHPTILEKHRISLQKEGERLAAMLEAQGQHDRARTLLDTISRAAPNESAEDAASSTPDSSSTATQAPASSDAAPNERDHARIEHLLRQADEAGARGRTTQAIRLLQEVVALDRGRRDVARMIRDLRWQEEERRRRSKRRIKLAAVTLLVGGLIAAVLWRENDVRRRFAAIPAAAPGDVESMRTRLGAIDDLVASERVWLSMAGAISERTDLQREISDSDSRAAVSRAAREEERARGRELAEAARRQGTTLAQQGRFEDALVELRRALELGGPDWSARREVENNVTAITEWIAKRPEARGNGR